MKCEIVPINESFRAVAFGRKGSIHELEYGPLAAESCKVAESALEAKPDLEASLKIGRKISKCLRLESLISPSDPSVIYLTPDDPNKIWLMLEPIAWELTTGNNSGFLPLSNHILVRGYGTQTHPPLVTAEQELKILVVCGATASHHTHDSIDMPSAKSVLVKPAERRLIPVRIEVVEGENTLLALHEKLREDKRWDIVHVIAHGTRDGQKLVLDTDGHESYCKFEDFASILQGIGDPRLVTLSVCDSSPLALEIAGRFPKARIICSLYSPQQQTLHRFFGSFYDRLFDAEKNPMATVEEAFGEAILHLYRAHCPDWFLPVLYAPATEALVPLLDSEIERQLAEIPTLVKKGEFEKAKVRAHTLSESPKPALRKAATDYKGNVLLISRFHDQWKSFEEAADRDIALPGAEGWNKLRDRLTSRDFRAPMSFGAAAHSLPSGDGAVSFLPVFKGIYDDLESLRLKVTEAVSKLCSYENGTAGNLLIGCRLLLDAATSRPKLKAAAQAGFVHGLRSIVTKADSGLDRANRSELDRLAKSVYQSLVTLSEVDTLAAQAGRELLSDEDAAEMTASVSRTTEKARDLLSGATKPKREADSDWLLPGRRIDLCLWWLGSGGPANVIAVELPSSLPELVAFAKELSQSAPAGRTRGLHLDPASFPPEQVSLLVNEAAPFLLTRELSQPLDPYLCLAGLGAGPNTTAQDLRDRISFAAAEVSDSGRREILTQASLELGDLRRRLCFDALRFPVENANVCGEHFREFAELALRGTEVRRSLPADLSPLDRAGLLAVLGRVSEASELAASLALERIDDADRVRGAYLAAVHYAGLLTLGSDAFAIAVRQAMAFLGILIGPPQLLPGWIGKRYAIYQQAVPADRSALTDLVASELQSVLRNLLDRAEAGGAAVLVRRLRRELSAELEGAQERGTAQLFGNRGGGYHAARLSGTLARDGRQLADVYLRLVRLTPQAYVPYVAATGMAIEVFHRLVSLFSDLRVAATEPSNEALHLLRSLLPNPEDLSSEMEAPPAIGELLAKPDAAERYPCHAVIEQPLGANVLAAHAAFLASASYLEELRRELAGTQQPARTTSILDTISGLKTYVSNLGYLLAGSPPDLMGPAEVLCTAWIGRVEQEAAAAEPEARRDRIQAATRLADRLADRYGLRGQFNAARAKLHMIYSVLLANEFHDADKSMGHIRMAYSCDPDSPMIVCNYARACGNYAPFLAQAGRKEEGRRALEQGLEVISAFVERHSESASEVEKERIDLVRALRNFDVNPQAGPPQRLVSE